MQIFKNKKYLNKYFIIVSVIFFKAHTVVTNYSYAQEVSNWPHLR